MHVENGYIATPKGGFQYPPVCKERYNMAMFEEVLSFCADEINTSILPWLKESHSNKVDAFTEALNSLHDADTKRYETAHREGAAYFPFRFDAETQKVTTAPIGDSITLNQFRDEMTRLHRKVIGTVQESVAPCSKHRGAINLESFKTDLSHKLSSGPVKEAYSMFQTTVPENTPFRGC